MKENDIKKEPDDDDEEPEGQSDMKTTKPTMTYEILLPLRERNGMHLLAARWNMTFSNVVTVALDELLRLKLSMGNLTMLSDSDDTNQLIGETLCRDLGLKYYCENDNPISKDKKHYFVPNDNEDKME